MDNLKVPPYNLEAEQSYWGQCSCQVRQLSWLQNSCSLGFYKQSHQRIFEVIASLNEDREPVDLITVTEALRSHKLLEQVGGATYLTTLTETVPTAANITQYCKIVEEKALIRRLINTASVYCQWPMTSKMM